VSTTLVNACILSAKNAYALVHARLCSGAAASLPWKPLRTYHNDGLFWLQADVKPDKMKKMKG